MNREKGWNFIHEKSPPKNGAYVVFAFDSRQDLFVCIKQLYEVKTDTWEVLDIIDLNTPFFTEEQLNSYFHPRQFDKQRRQRRYRIYAWVEYAYKKLPQIDMEKVYSLYKVILERHRKQEKAGKV